MRGMGKDESFTHSPADDHALGITPSFWPMLYQDHGFWSPLSLAVLLPQAPTFLRTLSSVSGRLMSKQMSTASESG